VNLQMTKPALSDRARGTSSLTYADFPLGPSDVDLRGDGSSPLESLDAVLDDLALTPSDIASYGPVDGLPQLKAVIAELFGFGADSVVITSGGSEALHIAFTCLADPGETIEIPRPAFPGFRQLAQLAGLSVTRYEVPIDAIEHVPDLRPGLAVVCTPHNPLGTISKRHAVHAPASRIVWDVSHAYLYGDSMASFRDAIEDADVVVFSLSKLLRMPGARIGCLLARSSELIEAATAVKTHLSMSASVPSQLIALRLLTDPKTKPALCARQAELARARRALTRAITDSTTLKVTAGLAGTHLYCQSLEGSDPWQTLKNRGLVGLPGRVFDATEPGVRLCFAQEPTLIREAIDRITRLHRQEA
jgi:aspartate/methionine/tyrosine aminotransferase